MRIEVTPDEFMKIIILYLLERMEERKLELPNDTEKGYIQLDEDSEYMIDMFAKRNFGVEFRKMKFGMPIVTRNKYNFIKKAFKGDALSDNIIKIKGSKNE